MTTPPRLYEHLVSAALSSLIAAEPPSLVEVEELAIAHSHERLARYLFDEITRALRAVGGDKRERLQRQVAIANALIAQLRGLVPPGPPPDVDLASPPRLLYSLHDGAPPPRTALPFSLSALLTRARGEPAIGHELMREIETADRIDALVSFVKMGGVRAIREKLERHAQAGKPFRLLTATYMGATEAEAVEALAWLPGAEIRVSYDARRTRLHAKAWLFSRESGLDTAYVGSANLSHSALFHGHEWMVKAAAGDLPGVLEKFRGAFETLWNDAEFEPFDPASAEDRARLQSALDLERSGGARRQVGATPIFFHLAPYPFQAAILDRLHAEREVHGRRRNLVVAATGTGKTVVAAFDYARRIGASGLRPRLLFLAHREELLTQALATFRQVLRDGAFGEVLGGGREPRAYDHLFATIQSFNARGLLETLGRDYWSHIVLDECHHAPAESYRAVIDGVSPEILVGLTATPERADGRSLLGDFDGHVAAELRLWHALERQLLTPFEYYGISDGTALQGVRWARGGYHVDDLDKLYTGNDLRAELVFEQTRRRVGDLHSMRALGFCVSVAHAEFMARKFSAFGVPAIAVHGASPAAVRQAARRDLETRAVNVVFTCDLYNEGVDLPFVDTLLMLRPTASASLFQQQLGRGLRLNEGKAVCLVLDFIGHHREDFRFDAVLSTLTGLPRGGLRDAVEQGFPLLPSGCHLALDAVAKDQVLASLKRSLRGGGERLADELRVVAARHGQGVTLADFLGETGRELEDVFDGKVSWSRLRRRAGLDATPFGPDEEQLVVKLQYLLHVDDPGRLRAYLRILADGAPGDRLTPHEQRQVLMLAYRMFHERTRHFDPAGFLALVRANPSVLNDVIAIFAVRLEQVGLASPAAFPAPDWPIALHHRYDRREILTAVGRWSTTAKPDSREGVLRLEADKTELLFVTLDKGERRFSPTTSYEDYAISADLFHWQTQSQVRPQSQAGTRYIEQARNGWRFLLFVRATVHDVYTYLGPVRYVSHTGERPMSITWRVETPIPGQWLQEYLRFAA